MPVLADSKLRKRYNSLRLLGFDYSSTTTLYLITIATDSRRPVFGDIKLAKACLAALLDPRTLARLTVRAYTLLPDHFHLLTGLRQEGSDLSSALGAFKSYTTQLYWKRSREIVEADSVRLPVRSVAKDEGDKAPLLRALSEWRVALRPEAVALKQWASVKPQHFLSKQLWHGSFNDHVIRNEHDLRETVEYIAMNPVKRGYVTRPEYCPFTGFVFD